MESDINSINANFKKMEQELIRQTEVVYDVVRIFSLTIFEDCLIPNNFTAEICIVFNYILDLTFIIKSRCNKSFLVG